MNLYHLARHQLLRVNGPSKSKIQQSDPLQDKNHAINNPKNPEEKDNRNSNLAQRRIIWKNAIAITLFHVVSVVAFFLTFHKMKFWTLIWMLACGGIFGFGVTAGAHRLWSHRSYKARLPLQIMLLILYSAAGMNSIYDWVRDHRVHHKYSETDADPHNANRGFFFAHVGWLMQKKHPEVIRRGKTIDMSDITNDPLLRFHTKYFLFFKIIMCFVLPIWVPMYFWQECFLYAFCSQALLRYMWILNVTWSVNSFAHIWGQKPYDKRIQPVENIGVSIAALGEGWHNYHHVFPWDYKAAELGNYKLNVTTLFLDFFSKIGLVYDMKTASPELVDKISEKYGDGSRVHEVPSEFADVK
ncbi:hypothetical protein V9T40_003852 [Parthenolecanium corni]|uniref:Fatty acid desaturase domain-containing protein n=1 Tax=Parthenolecanium corni TaxID=536013 RepID=A0AAN9TTG8_9HEMI